MADSVTPFLGLVKPEVGGSRNDWGAKLNSNMDKLDTSVQEAPVNGNLYARTNRGWTVIPPVDGWIYIGVSPPPNPVVGQLWWESDTGDTFMWYDDGGGGAWQQQNTPGPAGPQGDQGIQGNTGAAGVPGPAGALMSAAYTFSTTITEPPASGEVRGNNATQSLITKLWFHYTDAAAKDQKALFHSVDSTVKITLQAATSTIWQGYRVTGAPVDKTTYVEVPVVFDSAGTALTNALAVTSLFASSTIDSINHDANSPTIAFAVTDANGRSIMSVYQDGSIHTPLMDLPTVVVSDITHNSDATEVAFAITDPTGRAAFVVHHDGTIQTSSFTVTPDGVFNASGGGVPVPGDNSYMLPLIPPHLYGVEGEEMTLHAESMLTNRADGSRVRLAVHGNDMTGYQRLARDQVTLRPDQMIDYPTVQSGDGVVAIRGVPDGMQYYGEQRITVHVAKKTPPSGGSPTILIFGDSITQRGAVSYLKLWLGRWGFTPTFVGTLGGDAYAGDTGGSSTRYGEGKPGHWFADFVYRNTNRVDPLPAGQESAYATMDIINRRLWNTFLQTEGVASSDGGAVNPLDVRNGQYIDFRRYAGRHPTFFTAQPNQLIFGPGTNDATHYEGDMEQMFYDDIVTVVRRWYAAFPASTRPVYFMPPTQLSIARELVWNNYCEAFRGAMRAQKDCATAGIPFIVAPTWVQTSDVADYDTLAIPETPDPDIGSVVRSMPDPVHVTKSGIASLYKHVAFAVACASTGV